MGRSADSCGEIRRSCHVRLCDDELGGCLFGGDIQEDKNDQDEEKMAEVEEEEGELGLDPERIVMFSLPETPSEGEVDVDPVASREVFHTPPEESEQLKLPTEENIWDVDENVGVKRNANAALESQDIEMLESSDVRVSPRGIDEIPASTEVFVTGTSNPSRSYPEKSTDSLPAGKSIGDDVQIHGDRCIKLGKKRELPRSICGEKEKTTCKDLDMQNSKVKLLKLLSMLAEDGDIDAEIESMSLLNIARRSGMSFTSRQP